MSKVEEKTVELMKKAKDFIPDGGYSEKELNLAFYMFNKGYQQAEKDLELTWGDMSFIRLVFDAIEANIHLGAIKIQPMTKEYYQEVLKRFKEKKYGNNR